MKKNVLLGVSSSVAIYKSCELVRLLRKNSFEVKVVMTENASKLISPQLFQSLSANQVYVNMFSNEELSMRHITLSKWADLYIIAPCSLATLSKITSGICDNLLVAAAFSLEKNKKIIIAPAMNTSMWENPITQANINKIRSIDRFILVDPIEGELACGDKGKGKMADVSCLFDILKKEIDR